MGYRYSTSDKLFARIFLIIDSRDSTTVDELVEILGISKSPIHHALPELEAMGCIEGNYLASGRKEWFSTGHNCWYCTPTIKYESETNG